jgi:hypothetical protein
VRTCEDLTCEDRGFEELDKLVDLDEHVDSHFEVGTSVVSFNVRMNMYYKSLQYLKKMICLLVGLCQKTE